MSKTAFLGGHWVLRANLRVEHRERILPNCKWFLERKGCSTCLVRSWDSCTVCSWTSRSSSGSSPRTTAESKNRLLKVKPNVYWNFAFWVVCYFKMEVWIYNRKKIPMEREKQPVWVTLTSFPKTIAYDVFYYGMHNCFLNQISNQPYVFDVR